MQDMKNSKKLGIEEIPKNWKISRLKYISEILYGFPLDSKLFSNYSGFPLIRIRDITSGEINTYYTGSFPKEYIVHKGDILLSMDGDFNIRKWNNVDGVLNQRCCKIIGSSRVLKEFIIYALQNILKIKNDMTYSTTVKHLLADGIANLPIAYPDVDLQQKIADFLDSKCADIDSLAEDIQKQIETLQKYKKSVITKAVTKGLDPNVEMKDSEIECIGDIPTSWNIVRLKYLVTDIFDIDHYMPKDSNELDSIPYLMIADLREKLSCVNFSSCKKISKQDYSSLSKKNRNQIGDVIFARYATIGTVCYIDINKKFLVSYACLTIKPKKDVLGKYLYYYFKSDNFNNEAIRIINANTQGNIGKESLRKVRIALPQTVQSQETITDFLDSKCADIDAAIAGKQKQLDVLKEYKKSLIYEYVTGKKEVPCGE